MTFYISRTAEAAIDYVISQKSDSFIFDNEFAVRKIDFPIKYLKNKISQFRTKVEKILYIYIYIYNKYIRVGVDYPFLLF
jgi:hypothetical protein